MLKPSFLRSFKCSYCGVKFRGSRAVIALEAHKREEHTIELILDMIPFVAASAIVVATLRELGNINDS